jgi:hypothetical protein
MRKLILALLAAALAWSLAAQDEAPAGSPAPSPTPIPAQQGDSPMVRAAKSAAATTSTSKKRIKITNEDVKKSSGKLTIVSAAPTPKPTPEPPPPVDKPGEREARELAEAHEAARARHEEAQKRVANLERVLNRAEEAYYEAYEEDERDTVEKRFAQAKEDLEKARQDVDRTRQELSRFE